jgi:alkylation response protein AidB-like acyl-CoA dehydrogenase
MNFDFSDQETAFLSRLTAEAEAFARGRDLESGDLETVRGHLTEALAALAPLGYLKIGLPGRQEAPVSGSLALMAAMERLAAVSPSLFLAVEMSTRLFGRALSLGEPTKASETLAKRVAAGDLVGAVALSEEALNVENDPLATSGTREGDMVRVSGAKRYVVNGPVADWLAVAGQMDGKTVLFLVERQAPGLQLSERLETMGYNGLAIGRLALDGCPVPAAQVLVPPETERVLDRLKLWENQVLIAAALGLLQAAFAQARDHAKTHRSGGKPIIAYQEVGFKLAEMLTLCQTAQLYAYRAAWTADDAPREAEALTLCAKVFCTEAAETVASQALQILSGQGYCAGGPAERAYRCAKYGQVAGISSEIARVKIGDAALGKL